MRYPESAMAISPTAQGFQAAFKRPSLTLAEISWRWIVGATATAVFLFGLSEYLNTLPVTNGDLLFLRTRHPYLVAEAIAHILRGSMSRVVIAALVATLLLGVLWIIAASVGRIATVRTLLDYFRSDVFRAIAKRDGSWNLETYPAMDVSANDIGNPSAFSTLVRLNFLRAMVVVAAACGLFGAMIVAGFVSSDANPHPGLVFLLFLPLAFLVGCAWWALNWILSLAGIFAVRDGESAIGAISAAVSFLRERLGAVSAVTSWTGVGHLVAFIVVSVAASMPLGLAGVLPWRLVALGVIFVTLIYFVVADWICMWRLAGYVCIAEVPEELMRPAPLPAAPPPVLPSVMSPSGGQHGEPTLQTSIDRDELILSDVPNPPTTG
jgi:hypothetical protein